MSKSVDDGFKIFLGSLVPSGTESQAAKNHRESIRKCLKSNFDMTDFFRSGSYGNGTSVRSYSDIDYFARIRTEDLKRDSRTTLAQVATVLRNRFPNTGVRVDAPAVVVPFGNDASETTEVIPADYIKGSVGNRIYEIPTSSGTWKQSSPDLHNAYVRSIDGNFSNEVKPLVRFLKAWKYYNNVHMSSFYIEILTTKYASGEQAIIYDIDVRNVLRKMSDSNLAGFSDPKGVSGTISACRTTTQKDTALSKVNTALTRADKAIGAKDNGKVRSAYEWWDLVFNGNFPAY